MKNITEKEAEWIDEKGILLGKQEPCAESKWSWYEIKFHEGNIYAIVCDSQMGVCSAEEISFADIGKYISGEELGKAENSYLKLTNQASAL